MKNIISFLLSLAIVGFGQSAFCWWCGLLAACFGFALFWHSILDWASGKQRFWIGTAWFTGVQLIQLDWLVSHPYLYIYPVYFLLAFGIGAQFGLLTWLITPQRIGKLHQLLALSGVWVILEWLRIFFFSGFPWNPVGMSLAANVYSLQMASLWGVYGLSFWVIFTNLLFLQALQHITFALRHALLLLTAFFLPYFYGAIQLKWHLPVMQMASNDKITALLVQTAFPAEEAIAFSSRQAMLDFVTEEWQRILKLLQKHQNEKVDLIALPEYVVPFGTYYPVFRYEFVRNAFEDTFGTEKAKQLPNLEAHLAYKLDTKTGPIWMVNNAFWAQAISKLFQADVVIGLEDRETLTNNKEACYSSAFHFHPNGQCVERYEKQVLVPMGEYIPFSFCRALAAKYGVTGSFTPGQEAKIFSCGKIPLGVSICYEEIYGHLMKSNRRKGAQMLVNISNDGWYPNSRLPRQHFEHARLRTVEMGVPMVRACNTGLTGACDSLGRTVAILGEYSENPESIAEAFLVQVPRYHFRTLYTYVGDWMVLGMSAFFMLFSFFIKKQDRHDRKDR